MLKDDQIDQELARTLGDPEVHKFRSVLQDVDANWVAPVHSIRQGKTRKRRFPSVIGIAASILLLAIAGYWTLGSQDPTLDDYLQPYEVSFAVRGATVNEGALLTQAQQDYQAGNFEAAAQQFRQLDQANNPTLTFYTGVSLLLANKAQEAVPYLSTLRQQDDHLYQEQATFYLGLAYAKTGAIEKAKATLRDISPNAFRYEEAQGVLGLLK